MADLARIAREQIKRAELLGKSLDARLRAKMQAAPDWIPDEDFRRDFQAINTVIQHSGNSLVRALESNKKNLAGATEAQLEAQFNAEIVRAAETMTDEQWQAMCAARSKK